MANEFVVKNGIHIGGHAKMTANAQYFYGRNAAGTETRMLGINAADAVYLGSVDVAAATLNILAGPAEYILTYDAGTDALALKTANTDRITVTGVNISIDTGGYNAAVNISTGAGVKTLVLGSTNTTSVSTLQSGTGGTNVTSTGAFTVSGAAASSIYTTNAALSIYTGTGGIDISTDAANTAVNIATGAAVKTARLGSTNTTSGTTVQSGTSGTSVTSTGAFTVSGAAGSSIYTANANLMIYAGTGRLYIGDDAAANTMRFGAGAAAKDVTIGSNNTTSNTLLQSGTAGTSITSTGFFSITSSGAADCNIYTSGGGKINMYTGAASLNISADAAATAVNVATGAGVKTLIVGSTNTTSISTLQSGTGGTVITSTGFFTLTSSGAADCNIYTSANAKINMYTGTGTISISGDAAATTVAIATGAGAKTLTLGSTTTTSGITIQSGGSGITITSPGNVSLTTSTYAGVAAKVAMTTDTAGWIKGNGMYFVPAGGTGLQALLQAIIATTESPGTIFLGAGTHTINWTVATTINQEVKIVGTGAGAIINFSSTDADCCLLFTSRCHLESIKFTGPNPGWLAIAVVKFSGARSVIKDCNFECAPWQAGASYLLQLDADDILVDHCTFVPASVGGAAATDFCVSLTANANYARIRDCTFYCDFCSNSSIDVAAVTDTVVESCFFYTNSAVGSTRITIGAGATYAYLSKCRWTNLESSIGRIITFSASDAGGSHLVEGCGITESATGTGRASCIYVAQPGVKIVNTAIYTDGRDHGGAPDTNPDRAAIYIVCHYAAVQGCSINLGGTAQLGITVRDTGNVAANVATEGPIIENNLILGIDGNTAGRTGLGVHVISNATYRPRRGMICNNKFIADSNTASYAVSTLAGGNGADSWVLIGNSVLTVTGFSTGDWTSGAQEVMVNNQAP